jgi:hypothetical protein
VCAEGKIRFGGYALFEADAGWGVDSGASQSVGQWRGAQSGPVGGVEGGK